jgi:Ca2+-binding RTX toxin-like protein
MAILTSVFDTVFPVNGGNTIIGTTNYSKVSYGYCTQPVIVNMQTMSVKIGSLDVDALQNIYIVSGTEFNDKFIGSAADEEFSGFGGNDTFIGGGGTDGVTYWGIKPSDVNITYNNLSDTFTVKKTMYFRGPDKSVDTLTDIDSIKFYGPNNYCEYINKWDVTTNFVELPSMPVALTWGALRTTGIKTGDFNGDSIPDFLLIQAHGWGGDEDGIPMRIFLGDGIGGFTESLASIFSSGATLAYTAYPLVADFNIDGISDVFQVNFGLDHDPFPGSLNQLFLSSTVNGKLEDVSHTLQQTTQLNHRGSVGDVNGDGYPDVLVNSLKDGNFLQINDGTGHFVERSDLIPHPLISDPAAPNRAPIAQTNTSSAIVDVNGDSYADIILGKWGNWSSTPDSQVLLNDSNGNFTKTQPIALPTSGVFEESILDIKPIDLNGDNLPDLMLDITNGGDKSQYYQTPYIQLLINDGAGKFHDETSIRLPQNLVGSGGWYTELSAVDFNKDGYMDIFAISAGSVLPSVSTPSVVYLNRGDGTFYKYWESDPRAMTITEDVNGDGMVDLISHEPTLGITVALNELNNQHIYVANFGGDDLIGSSKSDQFYSKNGIDNFDGNGGIDILTLQSNKASYKITSNGSSWTIRDTSNLDNVVNIKNIERLVFKDSSYAIDLNGNAGIATKIIGAVFGKEYLSNKQYVGFCLHLLDSGISDTNLARVVLNAAHLTTNDEIISTLLRNVLGTTASNADKASLLDLLNKGASQSDIVLMEANTPENISNINLNGLFLTGIEYSDYENHTPTGTTFILGRPTQGQTLTASNTLADADGLGAVNYQWLRDGAVITNPTQSTYVLTQVDVGKKISVKANYVDGFGTAESVSSDATSNIINANDFPSGSVIIAGTFTQNQTLTASNTLADADGLGAVNYQWLNNGDAIPNATQSTYKLTQVDVGKKISVKANYVDGFGTAESVSSDPASSIINVNDTPKGNVTISGNVTKGLLLTASNNLTDVDGLGTISYQWLNNGDAIPNATQSTYKLTQADTGQNISVKASYTDLQNTPESVSSSNIQIASNSAPTGIATIKGTSLYGSTLSVSKTIKDADGIGKPSYTWQNDHGTLSTSPTYTLANSDVGTKVWVTLSYTDKNGSIEQVDSKPVDVIISTKPSPFNDILAGTDGANKLNGLAGNDTLIGGLGKDSLTGGVGADVFKFNSVNDSSALPKQADTITDFKHAQGDKIDLSAIDANSVLPNDQAFTLISPATFSADATGQLRFDAKTSTLYGSTNADVAPEFAIVLSGVKTLVAEDLIL